MAAGFVAAPAERGSTCSPALASGRGGPSRCWGRWWDQTSVGRAAAGLTFGRLGNLSCGFQRCAEETPDCIGGEGGGQGAPLSPFPVAPDLCAEGRVLLQRMGLWLEGTLPACLHPGGSGSHPGAALAGKGRAPPAAHPQQSLAWVRLRGEIWQAGRRPCCSSLRPC